MSTPTPQHFKFDIHQQILKPKGNIRLIYVEKETYQVANGAYKSFVVTRESYGRYKALVILGGGQWQAPLILATSEAAESTWLALESLLAATEKMIEDKLEAMGAYFDKDLDDLMLLQG